MAVTAALALLAACSHPAEDTDRTPDTDTPAETDTDTDTGDADTDSGDTDFCGAGGFGLEVPWNADGPYGTARHALADDFTVELTDGSSWSLADHWTGCENYVFLPDSITKTYEDPTPAWNKDMADLVAESPRNTHYFFVSTQRDDATIADNLAGADDQRDRALADLSAEDAAWWADHLHVVATPAKDLGGWLQTVLKRGMGTGGFAIDRWQTLRGVGSLSDVDRQYSSDNWPFKANLAYAAHEARYLNMEADRQERMDAEHATVVPLWTGEVISQYAEMDVDLPSAAEMAGYDTFEIEVDMRCPDAESPEYNNCGAWDYLAYLWLQEDDGTWTEMGRFITSYHRETHWVLDASPMLVKLLDGGTRHFKWEWAPEWNVQPTETRLNLRFANTGKGMAPRELVPLFTGGSFGSTYNDGREPIDVDIPADAAKVELYTVVTGHGAGTHSCSEFCNHQHEFTVDGATHLYEFPDAGTADMCIPQIESQMVPNQWGTWWYGRGGWCPGELVHPFEDDVTDEVNVGGISTISYRGLYDGTTPEDGSGDIVLTSWLVVYQAI